MNTRSPNTPYQLRDGHADTLFAKLPQGKAPDYCRELLPNSTGKTQVAYDFVDSVDLDVPLVVLFHGSEGSSESHYAVELMKAVQQRGWNGVVAHFRNCGGIVDTAPVFYHLSDTPEIAFMLNTFARRYSTIYTVGVSLGGNALAKYLGEQGSNAVPRASAVVSVPADAVTAGTRFDQDMTRLIYTRYFLNSLLPEARAIPQFQTALSRQNCKTLGDFDDCLTASLHGFADRHDYYRRNSCKPLLKGVDTPSPSLNVVNDSSLPPEVLPTGRDVFLAVTLLQPAYGGYVGFVSRDRGRLNLRWLPQTVLDYFEQYQL